MEGDSVYSSVDRVCVHSQIMSTFTVCMCMIAHGDAEEHKYSHMLLVYCLCLVVRLLLVL